MSHGCWLSLILAPLLFAGFAASPPPARFQAPADPDYPVYRYTLPNGLRVWCQPQPGSQSLTAAVVLRAGSRYETRADNGISHFVEHMLFTGTAKRSEEEIRNAITRRGGDWNGMTSMETTTYYVRVAAEDMNLALDWLADLVFGATLPADKVERERKVIDQERWGKNGWLLDRLEGWGFGWNLDQEVRRALFPGSSLTFQVIGEDASLAAITRADLQAYYATRYTASNAVLVVAGNITPEEVVARATAYFGGLPTRPRPLGLPPAPSLRPGGPLQATVRGPLPTDQIRLATGARTAGITNPDRWTLEVLAAVLDKALMDEARYQRGLVYGIGAANIAYEDAGYFAINTSTSPQHRQAVLDIIDANLDRVRRGDLDPVRLAEAKATLQGQWALSMESNAARASWLAGWALILPDDQAIPDYRTEIANVSAADLSRAVETYFMPANRFLGVHDPIITVASGGRAAGIAAALGLAVLAGRRWWPGRRRRPPSGPSA